MDRDRAGWLAYGAAHNGSSPALNAVFSDQALRVAVDVVRDVSAPATVRVIVHTSCDSLRIVHPVTVLEHVEGSVTLPVHVQVPAAVFDFERVIHRCTVNQKRR